MDDVDLRGARESLVSCGRTLTDRGLLSQTSGNLSLRLGDDRLLITPSSVPYHEITPSDLVITDTDGTVIEGTRRPSSELPLHSLVYRTRPDLTAIVHTHSPMATTLAILNRPIPAVHYMIASLAVTEVQVATYATYGTAELAANVRDAFPAPARAVLIGNHGVVAGGPSLSVAANAAESVELLAGLYYRCLTVGDAVTISDEQMAEVLDKYREAGVLEPR